MGQTPPCYSYKLQGKTPVGACAGIHRLAHVFGPHLAMHGAARAHTSVHPVHHPFEEVTMMTITTSCLCAATLLAISTPVGAQGIEYVSHTITVADQNTNWTHTVNLPTFDPGL